MKKALASLIIIMLLLSITSCNGQQEDSSDVSFSNSSTEPSQLESEKSNESEDSLPKESWTETKKSSRAVITTEYTNYGNDWVTTTEKLDANGIIESKNITEIVDKKTIKESVYEYDGNGKIRHQEIAEFDRVNNLKTIELDTVKYTDTGIRMVQCSEYDISNENDEKLIKSQTIYKVSSDDSVVATVIEEYKEVQDVVVKSTETLYYKNGEPQFYKAVLQHDDSDIIKWMYFDAEQNPMFEKHVDDLLSPTIQIEMFYRDNGEYIKTIVENNTYKYYNVKNEENPELFFSTVIDPETSAQSDSTVYTPYTVSEAQALLDEMKSIYESFSECIAEPDYEPAGL